MSLPQVPSTATSLKDLPASSLRDLTQFIVSIAVPLAFLGAGWWWDVHLHLEEIRIGIERRDGTAAGELLHKDAWNILTIQSAMEQAKPGDHVRIWTSFFVNEHLEISVTLPKLLAKGVNIDIMVLNPANDGLLRSRFRLRSGFSDNPPDEARRMIQHQIKMLSDVKTNYGILTVKECDNMPPGVFYQVGKEVMLIGLFMPLNSFQEGPLMKWYPSSVQWGVFERNWEECWNNPSDSRP
jgi:hypothetical protein